MTTSGRQGRIGAWTAIAAAVLAAHTIVAPAFADAARVSRIQLDRGDTDLERARVDTMWIFDADFSDLTGDNAGWTSIDRSGTLAHENRWHRDTLRPCPRPEGDVGEWSWWCGEWNIACWKQPRGYGNDWIQYLERDFDLSEWSAPGDSVSFEWDQRYAMERWYDYGYVDVSDDGGENWSTLAVFNNGGFIGAGVPTDWNDPKGHHLLDLSSFAGIDVRMRFRFESDGAYSPQDQSNNPPQESVKDGAWQLDNFMWAVNASPVWTDDCESPGDNGWVHEGFPQTGHTGVVFRRGQYGIDFFTGRDGPDCFHPPVGTWMMAAVDSVTGKMVDDQDAWLVSPGIDVAGASKLVGRWTMWIDLPQNSNDLFDISLWSYEEGNCGEPGGFEDDGFEDEDPGAWYGGPFWGTWSEDWSAYAGNDSLRLRWEVWNDRTPTDPHMAGIFLVRQRVGVPSGPDPATRFTRDEWIWFNDWFVDDLAEALADTARLKVRDLDGVTSVTLLASNTGGAPFDAYPCAPEHTGDPVWFLVPPPANQMSPGSVIHYYFETVDGLGNAAVYPREAPDVLLEMSILPITGSVGEPGLLLVNKHGASVLGEERAYRHPSAYYYGEALGTLGYEFDLYDVEVPGGTIKSDGPDTSGMKYYDTQVWFAGDEDANVMLRSDQRNLIRWLEQASEGAERNLLLSGNKICWELKSPESAQETLAFLSEWMGTEYVASGLTDTFPTLREAEGGSWFMTHDDGECLLVAGCPELAEFDVIEPHASATAAEVVAEYETASREILPAGVAYTHPVNGHRAITLAFGLESMMDELLPNGHYATGLPDRADLMGNIMDYFGRVPDGPGTVVPGTSAYETRLEHAHPNPFNPRATIRYSTRSEGHVRIRVFDLAGRVVRMLVDAEMAAGAYCVDWDGTTDEGHRAASGVYFVKLEAAGETSARKVVLLK